MSHPPLPFFAVVVRLFVLRPADPNRASGEGKDGSDPPFVPLARHGEGLVSGTVSGTVSDPPSPSGGSLPSVCIPAGRLPGPHAGRTTSSDERRDVCRLIRAFLVVGGVSVGCAWTWPGVFPEADPAAVLVRYHTPNVYRAVVAGTTSRPAWPCSSPANCSSAHRGSGSPGWASVWGSGPAFRRGRFRLRPTGRRSSSARSITRTEPSRARPPEWLTIPERGLYTGVAIVGAVGSGKTSACMHPFAAPALRLASGQSRAARRRAGP